MKKVFWLAVIALVFIGFAVGFVTQRSFKVESYQNIDGYSVYPRPLYFDEEELADEIDKVDFIAEVIFTGERFTAYYGCKSIVEVECVFRGDTSLVGKCIAVFEPNYFENNPDDYRLISNFNLMQTNQSYYVFLLKRKYMDAYQNSLQYYEFMPYPKNFSIMSKTTTSHVPLDSNKIYYFKDISEYEFVFTSEDEFEKVKTFKESLIDKYCISK